jgi:hypothetical protein
MVTAILTTDHAWRRSHVIVGSAQVLLTRDLLLRSWRAPPTSQP